MKKNTLIFLLAALTACTTNHQHDGLYVANQAVTGIIKVWILNGNELTIYSAGSQAQAACKQWDDRIEVEGDRSYTFENDSTILVAGSPSEGTTLKMGKVSSKTKFTAAELNKLVDEKRREYIQFRRNSVPVQ